MLSYLTQKRLFYGWVVVIAFFITGTIIMGTGFSFGVFFKSIEGEFNLTRAATSAVFSANMVLGCLIAILGGWAIDRYGPKSVLLLMGIFTGLSLVLTSQTSSAWQLFITYSLLLALGTGAMWVATMSTVSRWFSKKRGLALGIASAGAGLGQVVMAPFATFLISTFDWRWAYIVMGLIAWLIVVPMSRLLKRDPYEIGTLPDGVQQDQTDVDAQKPKSEEGSFQPAGFSLLQASRTSSFWFLIFTQLLFAFCMLLVLTHMVPHATDMGISPAKAAAIISLIGAMAIAGRVIMGSVSDRIGRKATLVICSLVQAGSVVSLIWLNSLWTLYLFAFVYGLVNGGIGPAMAALISDTFGLRNIGAIIGVLGVGWGIGAALGPAIGGLVFDINNSYSMAFLIAAVASVAGTLLVNLIRGETH